jgi:hypothetical protein
MKSWFMAPFKSKACREGTLNEPFIFANLPLFVLQQNVMKGPDGQRRPPVIESLHKFGLICNADNMNAALIMTTMYNAYHFFNLSRTAAFLVASDECKSFKGF